MLRFTEIATIIKSVVLAEGQTHRLMGQKGGPRNRPCYGLNRYLLKIDRLRS